MERSRPRGATPRRLNRTVVGQRAEGPETEVQNRHPFGCDVEIGKIYACVPRTEPRAEAHKIKTASGFIHRSFLQHDAGLGAILLFRYLLLVTNESSVLTTRSSLAFGRDSVP